MCGVYQRGGGLESCGCINALLTNQNWWVKYSELMFVERLDEEENW